MLDREFGKYRLIRRLGRGGMADVYLAHDRVLDRDVALKLVEIRPTRESREIFDAERRGALLQESFSAVDAHVPAVHEYGIEAGHFYLDMEYVDGEDLAERVGRGPIEPAEAVRIVREVCEFLEKAHAFETTIDGIAVRGIIHGDLKPRNVRVNTANQVKVLDFGIAKGLSLSRQLTRNDFGSPAYLSPERLDSGSVDVHADCWSAGVLLYELLSGELPFRGDSNLQLERQILARVTPAPLPVHCPAALVRIVLKVLRGDLARRYPGASAIRADLEAFEAGRETEADREWRESLGAAAACSGPAAPDEGGAPRAGTPADGIALAGQVAAGGDLADAEATRRTTDREARAPDIGADSLDVGTDAEATRRTTAGTGGGDEASSLPLFPGLLSGLGAPPQKAAGARRPLVRLVLTAAALMAVVVVAGNEARVWTAARELRVEIATRPPSDTTDLWTRYEHLSRQSLVGVGVAGVRGPMRERLLSQANLVIGNYRQNAPAVREAQWRGAVSWLTSALSLEPADRAAAARLHYCEGHLARIDAEALQRRKEPPDDRFNEAVARFEEAARLDRNWPDPYLGLARIYIYGLQDLDKAIAAMNEAESRGYRPGTRELAQLADGYRSRAERLIKDADTLGGLPQQRDSLERAALDLRQALDLYQQAAGFGDAGTSLKLVRRRLDEVERRLDRIDPPNLLERILRQIK